MAKYNVRVQKGAVAQTPEDAQAISAKLNNKGGLILKAQVHAGGRGKGMLSSGLKGGVQVLKTPQEVAKFSKQMLGFTLKTIQTKPEGLKVDAVLVVEGVDIDKQFYLAFILDRNSQRPALIFSTEGGVEIEKVAREQPDKIWNIPFDFDKGLSEEQLNRVVKDLKLQDMADEAKTQIKNLYTLFKESDCTQLEINPWATCPDKDKLWCIDAKINIDDNARFRQKELSYMREHSLGTEDIDPLEETAVKAGLSYVALDGNIGCIVNGAGLAMSTMDIIKLYGSEPANFLDVGGGASVDQCKVAFEILSSHPHVNCILINIFGGILSCKTLSEGIVKAAELVNLKVPLVVRLSGNQSPEGLKIIEDYSKSKGLNIQTASTMAEGARKAVDLVKAMKK